MSQWGLDVRPSESPLSVLSRGIPSDSVAHLLIGAALLIAGLRGVRPAKIVNITIGAAYLLLGVVGFFLVGTPANILALNAPDHFLHLASAIVLLGVGLAAERTSQVATA